MRRKNLCEDGTWWALSFNFKWPHEGFGFSYDLIPPDEEENCYSAVIRIGFVTVIYEWGLIEE